jgi:hypothetical protein
MAVPNASDVVAKWQARTSAAQADYVKGAEQTDKDPTALAIAAIPRMRAQVLEAIDSGRVANGLRKAGKAGWLAGVQGKGAQNFANGVSNATDKATAAFTKLLAYEQTVQNQINAMPNITAADRKARMNKAFDLMSAYKSNG